MNSLFSTLAVTGSETSAMGTLDIVLFLVAVVGVIAFGIRQGNKLRRRGGIFPCRARSYLVASWFLTDCGKYFHGTIRRHVRSSR